MENGGSGNGDEVDPTSELPGAPDGAAAQNAANGSGAGSAAAARSRRRRMLILGSTAAAIVVLAAVAVFAATRSGSNDTGSASNTTTASSGQSNESSTASTGTTKPGTTPTTKPGEGSATSTPAAGASTTTPGGGTAPTTPTTTRGATPTTAKLDLSGGPSDDALSAAYERGFRAECASIWSHAGPDGILHDPDDGSPTAYRVTDCTDQMDPSDGTVYSDLGDAQQGGSDDADLAVEWLTVSQRLAPTTGAIFDVP
jgi:hypothetical protein